MSDVLVIRNPRSGRLAGGNRAPLPGRQCSLSDEIDALACTDARAIVIEGGDGTVQRFLTRLLRAVEPRQLPPIAVMPAGSTNVTASNLNRTRSYDEARDSLKQALASTAPAMTERSMLAVTLPDAVHFGFIFGLGIVAEGVERFSELRTNWVLLTTWRGSGIFARSLLTTRNLLSVETGEGRVDTFAMMATTLDKVLYGMRPYLAGEIPGRMHTTWIAAGAGGLWRRLPRLARGDPALFAERGFSSRDVTSLDLRFDGSFTLDGELYRSHGLPLAVTLSPPLRFLVL